MVHEQRHHKYKDEDTTHALQSLNSHIFDIEAVFLIKAVGVFNSRAMTPFGIDGSSIPLSIGRYVCEKYQVMLSIGVMSDQSP